MKWQIAFMLFLFSFAAFALPSDDEQTISITANTSLFNYKTGANSYEGDVKIDQGSTHLSADRVETKLNAEHKIIEATAYGINQPAEYSTIPKTKNALLIAKAKIIKFYPLKSIVILENEVTVSQGENSFHGPLIIYNMKDQTVAAPASKNGRATFVIEANQITL